MSVHPFLEAEHAAEILAVIAVFFTGLGIMRIRMMAVEKLHDVEPAFIDIEVNVPGLEAGGTGLPDPGLRIEAFDFLPGGKAEALPRPLLCAFGLMNSSSR